MKHDGDEPSWKDLTARRLTLQSMLQRENAKHPINSARRKRKHLLALEREYGRFFYSIFALCCQIGRTVHRGWG